MRQPLYLRCVTRIGGFTLLELIISIAIVAIVSVSLFASLNVAIKARQGSEEILQATRDASVALDFLQSDLEAALPPGKNDLSATDNATPQTVGIFDGSSTVSDNGFRNDHLIFSATVNGPAHDAGDADVKLVELMIKQPDNPSLGREPYLLRRVTSALVNSPPPQADEEIISRRIQGFSLRYWDGGQWQDSWDSSEQNNINPAAVEVTLDLQPPPGRPGLRAHCRRVVSLSTAVPQTDSTGLGDPGSVPGR